MVVKCLFWLAAVIGFAYAQSEASLLPANITLPPELEGQINQTTVEHVGNRTRDMFKKKCEKNGGPDAFTKAEHASTEFFENCMKSVVDTTVLQQEIEDAKPNGTVDEVFKKYCQKKPQLTQCFTNLDNGIKPCFTADEIKNLKTVRNVTDQLLEFVCFKEGDRIALFIAEGGQECFQEKTIELQACLNNTFGDDASFNMDNIGAGEFPVLTFAKEQCEKMTVMEECMVKVLETCKKPTSANIVESLFKFIQKVTPCKDFSDKKGNTASGLPVAAATVAMGLLTAMFL